MRRVVAPLVAAPVALAGAAVIALAYGTFVLLTIRWALGGGRRPRRRVGRWSLG
jgi:hypothetical protein